MPAVNHARRFRKIATLKSSFTMDFFRHHRATKQRSGTSGQDRYRCGPAKLSDTSRVGFRVMQSNIAGDSGNRQKIEILRACESQHQSDRIINAGIAVDDDRYGMVHCGSAPKSIITGPSTFLLLALSQRLLILPPNAPDH